MALPSLPHTTRFIASRQLLPGSRINGIDDQMNSVQQIVARPGGTLAVDTPIINSANVELTVVATANDSVVLPPAKSGLEIVIINSGAQSAQIFANGTDTINATAGNVGVALAAAACARYRCVKNGNWRRFVSA